MATKIKVEGNAAALFARIGTLREERNQARASYSSLLAEVGKLNGSLGVIDLCVIEPLVSSLEDAILELHVALQGTIPCVEALIPRGELSPADAETFGDDVDALNEAQAAILKTAAVVASIAERRKGGDHGPRDQ